MDSEVRRGGCEVGFGVPRGLGQGCTEGPELLGYQPLRGPQTGHHCSALVYFACPHHLCRVRHRACRLRDLDLHWAPWGLWHYYGVRDFLRHLCVLRCGMGGQGLGG